MRKRFCFFILLFIFLFNAFLLGFKLKILNDYNFIETFVKKIYNASREEPTTLESNNYSKKHNNSFVELTDNFYPKNKQDIKNIYYTVLNSGMEKFTFHCSDDYIECIDNLNDITNDKMTLSHINNFVSTFNSYNNIITTYNSYGKIELEIKKTYDLETRKKIEDKIQLIYNEIVSENNSDYENIKNIHDYIINNTKYDIHFENQKNPTFLSNTAYGPLFENHAICGGYSDLMAMFLDKLNIDNYKISNDKHIWNYLFINDRWVHLDLTWDDPVTNTGEDVLRYDYFLINTDILHKLDSIEHNYNMEIYEK